MNTLLRRWRILTLAERVIGVLRVCVVLRAGLTAARALYTIWKRKER